MFIQNCKCNALQSFALKKSNSWIINVDLYSKHALGSCFHEIQKTPVTLCICARSLTFYQSALNEILYLYNEVIPSIQNNN